MSGEPQNSSKLRLSAIWLLSISFFWLVVTFFNAREDILVSDIVTVTAFTALALALQVGILFLLKRFAPLLLVGFAVVNTFLLYGVFSAGLMRMPVWEQGLLYAGVTFFYFVIFDVVRRAPRGVAKLLRLAPLAVAALAGGAVAKASTEVEGYPSLRQTTNVAFVDKPNVYFLSFDAMVPPTLGAELLAIDALPYVDVLKAHGARLIPNVFADLVPTKKSLTTILKVAPDTVPNYDSIVSGRIESPLRAIFAANGYTTHFTFWTSYFGHAKGVYLDHYNILGSYNICNFLEDWARDVGIFGYCFLRDLPPFAEKKQKSISYETFATARVVKVANDKSGPHFYMQHYPVPGHTSLLFAGSPAEQKAFQERYLKLSERAAQAMNKMLEAIRASDPEAIIFIYGDHGAWISRQLEFEDDPELFVLDRWGTLGAVIDGGRCASYLDPPPGQRFQTTARIVASLLTCLSGGKSPLISSIDYGQIRQLEGERFEEYLYE
jgi:hypothetical protein